MEGTEISMKQWVDIPGNAPLIAAIRMLNDNMRNLAVQTEDLADAAVTTKKLAESAVDTSKLGDSVMEGFNIGDGAVTTDHLEDVLQLTIDQNTQDSQTAMTVANGKNTVFYQQEKPEGGAYADGDEWFDVDDGYRPHIYQDGSWNALQFGPGAIANGAIRTEQLAAGAITADSGIIRDLDAGVIKTGTLKAISIDACTMTAIEGSFTELIAGLSNAQRMQMGCDAAGHPFAKFYCAFTPNAPGVSIDQDSVDIGNTSFAPFSMEEYIGVGGYVS